MLGSLEAIKAERPENNLAFQLPSLQAMNYELSAMSYLPETRHPKPLEP
jgi:hypothetical protein